jgi:uncharacterized membrane protein YoaK (UPF0700 family)
MVAVAVAVPTVELVDFSLVLGVMAVRVAAELGQTLDRHLALVGLLTLVVVVVELAAGMDLTPQLVVLVVLVLLLSVILDLRKAQAELSHPPVGIPIIHF